MIHPDFDGATRTTEGVLRTIDLTGRTALVTGATSGLGAETVRALASAGATVILAARDFDAAIDLARRIRDQHPKADLDVIGMDLTDLNSVRTAAGVLALRPEGLDLLINNAGVMYPPLTRTPDGFELQFATNHLGHFLLTTELLPVLIATGERTGVTTRVITLSSDAHRAYPVDLADPQFFQRPYDKFIAYGQSKAANVLMTVELQRRMLGRPVAAYAVHPGIIITGLSRYMSHDDFKHMRTLTSRTPGRLANPKAIDQGAATTVWAAVAPELERRRGAYLSDCAVSRAAPHATDPETAQQLWELSTKLTALR
ncbi:SDR family NAD(P)-dependent oxidoreductase [Nocardia sp. SYP-A9097]|uniref:SDR family oxidoreductase n=1 Tax=Nocardia sp. SYP-A9097 TaxID=2663237 RepID=UPI00129A3EF6|nr:SDR family oxidoreductase [Nocardia sp. SYP-A9097]MRH90735.1 SDR family NAD(P)-dependent oxidoreductase [Nocardia sp. SYP-A9097]